MKFVALLMGLIACAYAQETTTTATDLATGVKPKGPFIRNLPADELRDFRRLCFASTLCKVFEVGQEWSLTPFCGKAQCVQSPDGFLIERVEDCGPLPKANPKCKIVNESSKNETFPACCPEFVCETGITLEYPTPQELHAEALKLAQQGGPGATHA